MPDRWSGREGLEAFISAYDRLHDAGIEEVRWAPGSGALTLLLSEVRGFGQVPDLLEEVELVFDGARLAGEGTRDLSMAEGQSIIGAQPTPEGVQLVLSRWGEVLRIGFDEVRVRVAPEGGRLRKPPLVVHASAVTWQGRGVLIRGRSGAGKSSLALELMAWGCRLVADDRVELRLERGQLMARPPRALIGLVEARGVGLLRAGSVGGTALALLVDLDREEPERLPPWREETVLGKALPLLHKPLTSGFAPAILQYLKAGRTEPRPPEPR